MDFVAVLFGYAAGRHEQQNVGGDAHIAPQIPFPQIFRYVAGRIISAPTHRFQKRFSNRREAEGGLPYRSFRQITQKNPPPSGGGFALLEIEMIFDDIHDEQVHHCCAGCEKSAEYQDSCCGVVREIL